jgi:hypothetical protein
LGGCLKFNTLRCPDKVIVPLQDVGLWLEKINLCGYRQAFEENGVNGEYLESLSTFTTEQILRFIRRCHMKWGDFITLCKELRRIKGLDFCHFISIPDLYIWFVPMHLAS